MFRLICLLSLVAVALGDTVVLNELVDQVLAGFSQTVVQAGKDSIPIEELNNEWSYKWKFIKGSGHMNCGDGYVRSLASLHRTGDVQMTTDGNRMVLNVALGLGTLEFGFGHCQFKANHLFSLTQKIDAQITSDSIAAQMTLVKNGDQCTTTVDRLELVDLGKIYVKTGGGELHKIEDKIIHWFTERYHSEIVGKVNSGLIDTARAHVQDINLCDKIPI